MAIGVDTRFLSAKTNLCRYFALKVDENFPLLA